MEKTPSGTSVGVDDPYAFAGRCDHVTDDGRCRFAVEHAERDPTFARERRREDYACPVVTDDSTEAGAPGASDASNASGVSDASGASGGSDGANPGMGNDGEHDGKYGRDAECDGTWTWCDCPHYRSRSRDHRCVRCGLEERRTTSSGKRPLLAEHHLSYAEARSSEGSHEITVSLCRWCHAKVHGSWARIDDDASPDPEAIAAREGRRSRERAEAAFETAAERRDERS
jgi:hypothetical protein